MWKRSCFFILPRWSRLIQLPASRYPSTRPQWKSSPQLDNLCLRVILPILCSHLFFISPPWHTAKPRRPPNCDFFLPVSHYPCDNWSISPTPLSSCPLAPVLLMGKVSECSGARLLRTPPSARVVSSTPPSLPACYPLWCNTLCNTYTLSHPTLPSSVSVRADSGGRQADEWRLDLLPGRLHDNGPVGCDRETKSWNSATHMHDTLHRQIFIFCCTIRWQLMM